MLKINIVIHMLNAHTLQYIRYVNYLFTFKFANKKIIINVFEMMKLEILFSHIIYL